MVSCAWCRSVVLLGLLLLLSLGEAGCGGAAAQPVDLRYLPAQVAYSSGPRACAAPAADGLCPPAAYTDREWRCPFPHAADRARIDDARVRIRIDVSATGSPEGVRILEDPGYGFGQVAAACALLYPYLPAHYPDGRTVAGSFEMRIHYSR